MKYPAYIPGEPDPNFVIRLRVVAHLLQTEQAHFVCIALKRAGGTLRQIKKVEGQLRLTLEQWQALNRLDRAFSNYPEPEHTLSCWYAAINPDSDRTPDLMRQLRVAWVLSMVEI